MREASSAGEVCLAQKKCVRTNFPLPCKSLPPSVEGKTHGTLKLVIDKVLWTRRSPGNVTVIASWWGERDNAYFRPIDIMTHVVRKNDDTTMIYPIKTSATLFEEYIKKCEAIELLVVLEKTQEVIGIGHIKELSQLFTYKPYSQIIPILNNSNNRIGKIHVCLYLTYLTKFPIIQMKKQTDDNILTVDNLQSCKNMDNIEKKDSIKYANIDRPIIKIKQPEMQKMIHTETLTDKLAEISEIVARAQQLREKVSKETYNEDFLDLSDSSMSHEPYLYTSRENKAKLYEYMLEKETFSDFSEKEKALNSLRLISPTSSLTDLASKTFATDKNDNVETRGDKNFSAESNNPVEKAMYRKMIYTESKEIDLLEYVNSMRIYIGSFMLTSAGYRHIKHYLPCLAHSNSITYFVQFDTKFGSVGQKNKKSDKEAKFIRIYAKKEQKIGTVIEFGSEGICSIPRHILNRDFPLRFKIFAQRVNQNPSELGRGHLNIVRIARTKNLSLTLGIPISGTGIKKGTLNVKAELGCHSRFGREFIQNTVMSTKENIPVLEIKSHGNTNSNKYKSATGTHSSKSSNKVSSASARRIECLTNKNDKDSFTTKDMTEHQERNLDNKKIDTSNPESAIEDKVLLYGLIYVSEGKNLSESNTYLICRAFWREDKAMSQVQCSRSGNPCYNFSQLVPLIYGTDLLERIRDNYIIIEVYSRKKQGTDNLLGIAKLPVHELYIAYKDPLILSVHLSSKDPIIGVDDWVSINDPVSGIRCGELLALVALGTAEQIAYLEMTRNLRIYNYHCQVPENTKYAVDDEESSYRNILEAPNLSSEQSTQNNHLVYHIYNTAERDCTSVDYRTQESQTDISSLKDARPQESAQEVISSERLGLHALVDRLADALHINKTKTDQSAQTETSQANEGDREELRLNTLKMFTDDSDSCSPRNDFQLPTEMYRSVGVGAEYDEELDQQQNNAYNNCSNSIITEENTEREETSNCDSSFFRSVVEIECGLHLPEIEGQNGATEPSTYVTFQDLTHKADDHLNSYRVTNVFTRSCNPKWNWICEAKLPTDLLLNNQKRLILKVWYLIDPDTSTEINLEKDIMIGFAAVDLSILMAGFTAVSGWFDIMDFTEKRNGQIKISVTPLDVPLGKIIPTSAINLPNLCNLLQINWQHSHDAAYNNESSNAHQNVIAYTSHKDRCIQNEQKINNSVVDIGHGLEDVSMSFLSSSLKQKLTELDHITKRLQSRLHDVTNTAFENEFDNDFDITEPNSDNENSDDKNGEIIAPQNCTVFAYSANEKLQMPNQYETESDRNVVNDEGPTSSVVSSNYDSHPEPASNHSRAISSEATDTGYYSSSNTRFSQHPGYYHNQYKNLHSLTRNFLSNNSAEYPARGTKTHINHLLDKLSLDLPPKPLSGTTTIPIRKNILELFANLRNHKNNLQDQHKSTRCVNTRSVPTQTDNTNEQQAHSLMTNLTISDTAISESVFKSSEESQPYSRISTVIREELVAEENSDSSNCDELTTYLITSNIRHMDVDCIFNPLLYQHFLPDLQVLSAASPEGEAVEQLDNRYARSFTRSHSTKNDALSRTETQTKNSNVLESEKNTELFHLTPSVSGSVDGSIDVTVIHKSGNNDLMSGNSAKLTVAASCDKSSAQQADTKKNHCSIAPELLAELSGVPRQAPEGGNPVEEAKTSVITKRQSGIQDTSTDS